MIVIDLGLGEGEMWKGEPSGLLGRGGSPLRYAIGGSLEAYSQPRVVCFRSGLELRMRDGMGNTS